jgi:uridine kinase
MIGKTEKMTTASEVLHLNATRLPNAAGGSPLSKAKPFVIGVSGGTGSGKSTVADRVISAAGHQQVAVVALDSYYKNHGHLSVEERAKVNYDHPDAFDWELMRTQLEALVAGESVDVPVYDFATHSRSEKTMTVNAAPIVIVEGILVLWDAPLRNCMDLKVFVDADADVRFIRRLQRDMRDRGRTSESVIAQYLETVRPAHLSFIEPSKRYADVIIPRGGHNEPALDMLTARIASLV